MTKVDVDPLIQATCGLGGVAPPPGSAQFAMYYGSYGPPFCHADAKALFATVT